MFTRSRISLSRRMILIGCVWLFSAGCAKENVTPAKPVEVSLKGSGDCLASFGENLDRFQKGELTNPEVESFWVCVEKAVSDYQRLTAGDLNGNYSPQAVRRFFQRYFIKSQAINDPLLTSIMEIKRVLLSGSAEAITSEELTALQGFIGLLKQITLDLNPHVKVIFMHSPQASDEQVSRAGEAAEKGLARLGDWLSVNRQTYSFAQMTELVRNLRSFGNQNGSTEFFDTIEKALAILPSAKQILLSGKKQEILGQEWPLLTLAIGQGYRSLLAVSYSFKENFSHALMREAMPTGLLYVVAILERGAQAHPKKEIPMSEWRDLFENFARTGWLGPEFSAEHLLAATQWMVDRAMGRGQRKPALAMTPQHLASLQLMLSQWSHLQKAAKNQDPQNTQEIDHKFAETLSRSAPHEWDQEGRMSFPLAAQKNWTVSSRAHMVWPFVIMNWLKEAYVGVDAPEVNGEQITVAAVEILGVLQSFGWLSSTKETIGLKLLRESDLFTLASNGNGLIDVSEASRYLAFIASSLRAAQIWLEQAKGPCPDKEAECVRRVGADLSRDIFAPMPRLQAWLKSGETPRRFVQYSRAGEETILGEAVEGEFKTGDLLQVWMIFQYVETFVQRFDRDFSDSVSLKESDKAFELFGPILEKMLSAFGLPPEELFGFFTFMMKYGDTPFTMYGGQVLYNHWKWHRNDWAFESDRTQLMGILNQLSKL